MPVDNMLKVCDNMNIVDGFVIIKEQAKRQNKVVDFSTMYKAALKALHQRKGVIDGLKNK